MIFKTTQVQAWVQSLAPGGFLVCSEHANNPAAMNSLRAAQAYIQELTDWGQVESVHMIEDTVVDNCAYICSTLVCRANQIEGQEITCPTLVLGLPIQVHKFAVVQGQEVQTKHVLLEFNLPPGQKSALNNIPGAYNVVLPVKIYYVQRKVL